MLLRSPSIVLIIASLGFTGVAAFLISRFQQHNSHSHWYVEIVSILGFSILSAMHTLLLIKNTDGGCRTRGYLVKSQVLYH